MDCRVIGHEKNIWLMISVPVWHIGHWELFVIWRLAKFDIKGRPLHKSCHKKICIFGAISIFQIQWNNQGVWDVELNPCTSQVDELTKKSPELVRPQHEESDISIKGGVRDT